MSLRPSASAASGPDWPRVPLGAVLAHRTEFVHIDDLATYKRCRAQLHAKGVVLRDVVTGAEIKTKNQQVCRTGDFLVAEIDAKVGGFGILPPVLDGAVVSSHYFLFSANATRLDRRFLDLYVRTSSFQDQIKAKGSTNYAAIRPADVLAYTLPLPPLDEQRRIVARVEALAARIEEARGLRRQAVEETSTLYSTATYGVFSAVAQAGYPASALDAVAPVNMGQSPPGTSYNELGEGTPLLNGPTEFGPSHPNALQWTTAPTKMCTARDILICVRGATTGRMNWADRKYCIGRGLAAMSVKQDRCLPAYVYRFVEAQTRHLLSLTAGSTFPNLPGAKLKALRIAVPPMPEQRRIVAYLDALQAKVDALRQLQAQTSAELDALLPSILERAFSGEL